MNDTDRYLILVEGGPPSNYSAWSPDLIGCVATGDTIEQLRLSDARGDRRAPSRDA